MRVETIGGCTLYNGDMRDVLATLPENSVDSIVCDPPYHLTSIVKRYADGAPAQYGKDGAFQRASAGFMGKQWDGGDIAFQPETWAACLHVLKPGGYILAFASTRGFGRMSVALEDAGFITHPMIAWVFGSGFPKATQTKVEGMEGWRYGGQALKPAMEPIYMGQKPFSEKTGTANIKRWGTGAINIDGCRVHADDAQEGRKRHGGGIAENHTSFVLPDSDHASPAGRWPANLIHDGSDEVLAAFPNTAPAKAGGKSGTNANPMDWKQENNDRQRQGHTDNGGSAARFFYTAKADKLDRIGSKHPTVKPVDLMQWLVRLVTPKGGMVLDPFAGSGTTGEAAWREGMRCILIEREEEYQADIAERLRVASAGPMERKARAIKQADNDNLPLFGGTETGVRGEGRQIYGHFADQDGRRRDNGR